MEKRCARRGIQALFVTSLASAALIAGCGDDESFSPVAKNRGYDYAFVKTNEFAEYPCNEMREGREAVVGRDKDRYECIFDERDSVYLWAGESDTLTAKGGEFVRAESSNSEEESSDSEDSSSDSEGSSSSRYSSSSSRYSSSSYSSSSRYSSSSYYFDTTWIFNKDYIDQTSIPFTLTSKDELLNPDIEYGTMVDERDGQVYRTVIVGNRVWMAENLNFAGNDDYPLVLERSACLNFDDDNCALLGRLYSREAALDNISCMKGAYCDIGDTMVRGVCPKGWHIPSNDEAWALVESFGDKLDDVRSAKGWGASYGVGANTSGFSMPASGCLEFLGNKFTNPGKTGYVWAYIKGSNLRYLIFRGSDGDVIIHSGYTVNIFVSVRCISDDTLNIALSSASIRSSSSVVSSSSSSIVLDAEIFDLESKEDLFNPDIDYGELVDARDGKKYRTVEVNGLTWMAENLNFYDTTDYPLLKGRARCYNGDEKNCELLGRMYARAAVMNDVRCAFRASCNLGSGPIQGICPEGWHVPTEAEMNDLISFVGSSRAGDVRSAKGWNSDISPGLDLYGLSFAAEGIIDSRGFVARGEYGHTWVYVASSGQYYLVIQGEKNNLEVNAFSSDELYMGTRCVKD